MPSKLSEEEKRDLWAMADRLPPSDPVRRWARRRLIRFGLLADPAEDAPRGPVGRRPMESTDANDQ